MNYLGLLLFVLVNYFSLFILSNQVQPNKLLNGCILLLVITIFSAMIINFMNIKVNVNGKYFTIYISVLIVLIIGVANILTSRLLDIIVQFHQRYNEANLNRNLIKFIIENQKSFKKVFSVIWFIGGIVMLAGNWLGDEH